jgi:nitrite reductase/ring-hydroxylating ferredoxin subunit
MAEVLVCRHGELPPGAVRIVCVDSTEVAVIRHQDDYFAYRNLCPHQGGPACEGVLMPGVVDRINDAGAFLGQGFDEADMHIVCPWHGYEFHLATGEHAGDKKLKLKRYDVVRRDDAIYVDV